MSPAGEKVTRRGVPWRVLPLLVVLREVMQERSTTRLVRIGVDFKSWLKNPPSVEQARPGRCVQCGAASHAAGGGLTVQGHGMRARQLRGPLEPGAEPRLLDLLLRRYLCIACGAVLTVAPKAVLPKRLFTAGAIALALALWAVEGEPSPVVRERISPLKSVGHTAARTWLTLRRWTRDARRIFQGVRPWPDGWPPRKVAERVATTLASLGPAGAAIPARAFVGATRTR